MSKKYVENLIESEVDIEEATEDVEVKENKKEEKLPDPIVLKTASGEGIMLTATSVSSYDKAYYTDYDKMMAYIKMVAETNASPAYLPRRIKHVKLPQSRDKITFRKTWDLFMHLTDNCGYRRIKM